MESRRRVKEESRTSAANIQTIWKNPPSEAAGFTESCNIYTDWEKVFLFNCDSISPELPERSQSSSMCYDTTTLTVERFRDNQSTAGKNNPHPIRTPDEEEFCSD